MGRVDGYCKENNTVYEYHGSFWHGNPDKYGASDVHPVSGEIYGAIYRKTLERDQKIRDQGYALITKWGD